MIRLAKESDIKSINSWSQELKPEKTQSFELGMRFHKNQMFKSDISLFYTYLKAVNKFNCNLYTL